MSPALRDFAGSFGFGRGIAALAMVLLTVAAVCVGAPERAAAVPASQRLVSLSENHVARTRPDVNARQIETVSARRPLTGVPTVLPVLGTATSSDGMSWTHVRLPGRPNGHHGWIPTEQTRRTSTEWHISLKLSTRRVTVYRDGRVERRFRAVIGKPSTPTPRGRFFIEEALSLAPRDVGAPFALATSARSQVLQEFAGGPGQIALHGTGNISGALGTAVSHGCVRLSPSAIRWLARRIGAGIPLTITK
jgi:lipoprotein-anchoring transpeptidase ErfK/SrfK